MKTKFRTWSMAWLVTLSAIGCGAGIELKKPDSFVELEDDSSDRYDVRMTSAHGVVLAARRVENESHGTLDFWTDAVSNRMRMNGGYALTETKDVRAATGQAGKQLRFGHDQNGRPYSYWLTLFVTDDHVYIVEAGGEGEEFERAQPSLESAIGQVRLD